MTSVIKVLVIELPITKGGKDVEALFLIIFIYLVLRALFFVLAEGIYSVFGDDMGDAILLAPLVIVLLLILKSCSG